MLQILTHLSIAIICFFNGIYYFVMPSIDRLVCFKVPEIYAFTYPSSYPRKTIPNLIGGALYILIGMTFFVALVSLALLQIMSRCMAHCEDDFFIACINWFIHLPIFARLAM